MYSFYNLFRTKRIPNYFFRLVHKSMANLSSSILLLPSFTLCLPDLFSLSSPTSPALRPLLGPTLTVFHHLLPSSFPARAIPFSAVATASPARRTRQWSTSTKSSTASRSPRRGSVACRRGARSEDPCKPPSRSSQVLLLLLYLLRRMGGSAGRGCAVGEFAAPIRRRRCPRATTNCRVGEGMRPSI
jgi:hypothetical protein